MDKTLPEAIPHLSTGLSHHTDVSTSSWSKSTLPNSTLFGTDGIRGKFGELLTPSLATQVGFWVGHFLKTNSGQSAPVIVGQDSRNSSKLLATALTQGFHAAGVEVWDLGLCPTPAVAYLTKITNAIGGVMISASHNPPEDNGIKVFGCDGSKLSTLIQTQIETALRQSNSFVKIPSLTHQKSYFRSELLEDYLSAIQIPLRIETQNTLPLKGMHIVLDLAWGAAVNLAPSAFQRLGAKVTSLHAKADGNRINVNCGSTHLATLQSAVVTLGADLGFAFDGDADRTLAVDGKGRVVDGDYLLYFWGQKLKQQGQLPGNLIVATVMSNLGFEQAWQQQGGTLIRTGVGDQHVLTEMLRSGAMLGGEQSGHILCRHYGVTGDGLATALHLAVLIQQSGISLVDLVNQSFQTYPQRLCNVRMMNCNHWMRLQECDELQQAVNWAETSLGNQGRILIRPSGTEPVIRVMVEAVADHLVDFWSNHLVTTIEQFLSMQN
ncbi:MAG TPA: phosphoglucosamine mutase [Allocoleopsis sp.]